MSQYDFGSINPSTTSGTALAALINSYRDAVNSGHMGASRPSYAVEGMQWVKDVSSTVSELYYYDGTNDILLCSVNPTTHMIIPITQANAEDSANTTAAWWSPERVWQAIEKFTTFVHTWTAKQTFNGGIGLPTTAVGDVYPGSYTPTLTNTTNISSSTASTLRYFRVGDRCTVFGSVSITATAASGTQTELRLSLPIAPSSNFASGGAAAGTIVFSSATPASSAYGMVTATVSSNTARAVYNANTTSAATYYLNFSYDCA